MASMGRTLSGGRPPTGASVARARGGEQREARPEQVERGDAPVLARQPDVGDPAAEVDGHLLLGRAHRPVAGHFERARLCSATGRRSGS